MFDDYNQLNSTYQTFEKERRSLDTAMILSREDRFASIK